MKFGAHPSKTDEQPLMFYPAHVKLLLRFVTAMLFVAVCILFALSSRDPWPRGIGIVGSVLFACVVFIILLSLVSRSPVLMVSQKGIQQRTPIWSAFVAWEEIAAIYELNTMFCVFLSERGVETFSAHNPWLGRLSRLAAPFYGAWPAIGLAGFYLPDPIPQVFKAIQKRYPQQIERLERSELDFL